MANTIYVLGGCTASGKTACALEWAQGRGSVEILSCDALLFYQGMDIGTAKPSDAERAAVPHHGIDLVPVRESFDIERYVRYAQETVRAIHARGHDVLVVGGSGFYLKSFFAPVTDGVDIPQEVATRVSELERAGGLAEMLEALRPLNPEGLGALDVHNPRRVAKALERCLATGKSYAQLRAHFEAQPSPFAQYGLKLAWIDCEDALLRERIVRRVRAMLAAGLVQEVRTLDAQGLRENPTAASSIGYAQTLQWLEQGGGDEDALVELISAATWQLVRKQRKWLRHQMPASTQRFSPLAGEVLPF